MRSIVCTLVILCVSLAIGSAGASDTLEIFGNANMDETIDEMDIAYVEGVIKGANAATNLSDANYDCKVDAEDLDQINLIIRDEEKELTIIDSMDRIVTLKMPIERIVTTHNHHIETMRALQMDMDKIIGVSQWTFDLDLFYPDFVEKQNIGGSPSFDAEKILTLRPDIVMIYTSTSPLSSINEFSNELESANLTVLRIDCYKVENYVDEIKKLGYILNKKVEAEEFINFYEEHMNIVTDKVGGISTEDRPKVYFAESEPYKTCSNENCRGLEIEMAGGKNIFGDATGMQFNVDPEEIIVRDPDIILIQRHPLGAYNSATNITEMSNLRDEIMNRSELANVTAVKNGKVYAIGSGFICKPGRFVGLAYMAKWFYPELFKDLDPQSIHQEYLDRFHKDLNLDVSKDTVFVYPQPAN